MSVRSLRSLVLLGALAAVGVAHSQSMAPGGMPPPDGMSLAQSAAMRFPQPVRVGDLLRRSVLEPVGTQRVLGTVAQVVRAADGTVDAVVNFGGFLGFGARPIAVPIDAMVLLGADMEVVAYTPAQLSAFPTYADGAAVLLAPDSQIKVGLAKPSH